MSRNVRAGIAALVACAASTSAAWADDALKVAAVFGTPVEEPWVERIHEALLDAQEQHGIRYSWSDDVAPDDVSRTLRNYAEQGYDLITGDSFGAEAAARVVAKDYPNIAFVFGSGGGPAAPNFSVFDNWIHEPAFLAGMIAGGITESDRVGAVAAMPIPEVNRLVNAFCSGALEVNPEAACEVGYIDAFFDPARAKAVAREMIEAGADVLYAERLGAIEAAAEAGIAAIGNLADQAALAPDALVTSVVWDMRPTFAYVLEQLRAGSLAPQDLGRLSFMRHGGAALAPYGRWESQLPDQAKALVAERSQAILDGTFRVIIDESVPDSGSSFGSTPMSVPSQPDRAESLRISPADAGFAADLPERLDQAIRDGRLPNLHAVLLARDGKLVLERYFEGPDERWGEQLGTVAFGPEIKHDLRSVSKSIVGLLYGIALAEGRVPALDQPLVDHFPYPDLAADPARRRMTVAHALSMTLGTQWDESLPYTDPRNSEIAMEMASDRYRFVLEQPIVAEPGSRWTYSGGATALLAHLIAEGTGSQLHDYAKEKLFAPLGITDTEWVLGTNDEPAAASGLRMRPRDLARIGQLVLQHGRWGERQLVPADWLDASFVPRAPSEEELAYGYQWWLWPRESRADGRRWMAGFGNGGQRLTIWPHLDLVLVVTAGNYNQPDAWKVPVTIIAEILFPALQRR